MEPAAGDRRRHFDSRNNRCGAAIFMRGVDCLDPSRYRCRPRQRLDHVAGSTGATSEAAFQARYSLPDIALLDMGDFAGGCSNICAVILCPG